MQIMRYELKEDRGSYILNIYLEPQMTEFAVELGKPSGRKTELQTHIRSIIKEKFQNVPITVVKVLVGSFVVTTLYLGASGNIASAQTPTQLQTAPKYDTYTVKAGDTLYKIARELNVAVADIKQANNLTTDMIHVGQELRLPYYTYTVVSGDTLYSIAKRHNTSVSVIQSYNQLSTNVLSVGQKIKIPQPITSVAPSAEPEEPVVVNPTPNLENPDAITPEPTAPPEQNVSTVTHMVAAGETLYAISRQYATTVSAIKNANNLTSDILSIGQMLIIPTAIESIQIPVDTTPPAEPIPTFAELITSESAASYPIRGTTEPGAVVQISISDGIHPSITTKVVANGNGEFSTNVDVTSLQDGSISIVMKASDNSGNESSVTKVNVSKDTSVAQPELHIPSLVTSANAENFVISGKTDANATITLRITDTANQLNEISIKADPNGHFETVLNVIGLQDGSLSLLATATDENGNKSEPKVATAQKDTSAITPTVEDIQGITPDNVSQYPLVGHAEPGAVVEVVFSDDGNQEIVTRANADSTGTFQDTADLRTLRDGDIQVTFRATDEVGNQSESQQTTIEKQTIIAAPELADLDVINSKNAENYQIIGKAQPGAVVDVSLSNGINPDHLVSTTANENGEFEVRVDVSMLIDTSIMVSAFQTSPNGLTSETFETTIIKDASNPNAPILHNTNFINQGNQSSYHLQGKGEPNAELLIRMFHPNGQVLNVTGTVNENGEFDMPVDLSSFDDGEVTFEIMQIDQAGNESERYAKMLVKDTIGPTDLTLESMSSIYSGNVLSYMLSGKTEAHTTLEIQFTDGTNTVTKTVESDQEGKFEQSFDLGELKDGRLIVTFRAIDNAGNVGTPKPVTIVKDTTAPAEVVTNLPDFINRSNQQPFTLKGSSIEEGAIVDILISDNERQLRKSAQVINGSFSDTVDLSVFKDGPLTFEFIQTDQAGNTGIVNSATVIKDTVVENPVVAKSGFRYENLQHLFTLLGSAEPGGTIEVTLFDSANNKLVSKRTIVDEEGYYAVDLFSQDIQAVHSATVKLTDAAGNLSGVTSVTLNTYTVSAGDTLYSIAKRYNTTVDALMALNHLPTDALVVTQTLRLPLTASEVVNLGYLYFGSTKEYANVVNSTGHAVNIVSPSYFDINPDGTLKLTYQVDQNFIDTMHRQGVRVVPFLSNHWNREVGRAMLQNKELAARQIADAIERYNLDGVNVDIENVTAQDRENYTEFVRLLRQLIPNHKEVSVAVAANPNGWEAGWHGSYDYTELANIADYLMIMAYDESYEGGEPGSVASHSWVEKSIQYAVSEGVAPDKVVLGTAHFGRYWQEGANYGGYGLSNWQVNMLIERYHGTIEFDEISKTPKATFTIKEGDPTTVISGRTLSLGTYTVWFENEKSIHHKLELVRKYNLRGVGNWSLGQEDKDIWNSYITKLPNTVPVVSPVKPSEPAQAEYTTYRVVAGDSLWLIASKNQTTIDEIRALNSLTSDMLYVGQVLKLPTTNVSPTTTAAEPESIQDPVAETEPGTETEHAIEAEQETILDPVAEAEPGAETVPEPGAEAEPVGEPILEPVSEPEYVPEPSVAPTTTTIMKPYTVVAGDTLYSIARKYGISVTAIKSASNLTSDFLTVGQILKIPQEVVIHKVASGDTLYSIARTYNTTVTAIKSVNNFSTDIIHLGQTIIIP